MCFELIQKKPFQKIAKATAKFFGNAIADKTREVPRTVISKT